MNILFDTNIILDIALKREPHFSASSDVFMKINNTDLFGFVTATTITDIYYIAKREKGHQLTIDFISDLIQIIDIIGVNKETIVESLNSKLSDFEDAIQSVSAKLNDIEFIITRNIKDYNNSEIKAITPLDFLAKINH
jgi:predicted nucleic acid-binding protein